MEAQLKDENRDLFLPHSAKNATQHKQSNAVGGKKGKDHFFSEQQSHNDDLEIDSDMNWLQSDAIQNEIAESISFDDLDHDLSSSFLDQTVLNDTSNVNLFQENIHAPNNSLLRNENQSAKNSHLLAKNPRMPHYQLETNLIDDSYLSEFTFQNEAQNLETTPKAKTSKSIDSIEKSRHSTSGLEYASTQDKYKSSAPLPGFAFNEPKTSSQLKPDQNEPFEETDISSLLSNLESLTNLTPSSHDFIVENALS